MSDKEAVKVIVRCRPMNEREDNLNCKAQFEKNFFSGQFIPFLNLKTFKTKSKDDFEKN